MICQHCGGLISAERIANTRNHRAPMFCSSRCHNKDSTQVQLQGAKLIRYMRKHCPDTLRRLLATVENDKRKRLALNRTPR